MHTGTNDLTNSIDTIANMKKILADVNKNSPTTKIIVSTVITREDRKDMKKKVNALNSSLKAFCTVAEKGQNVTEFKKLLRN